jgi:multidrug transporter EmrE-like cation transporter
MLYLFLAILCSTSIAVIFKFSESNKMNRLLVTNSNYMAAFLVSLFMVSIDYKTGYININSFSFAYSICLGIFSGIFFFLSFIFYQKSVSENGIGLSGTFGKLGILIPMCLSMAMWHEFPNPFQWIGIFLSLISIFVVNSSVFKHKTSNFSLTLILLFLFGGMADFSNKLFEKYTKYGYMNLFLSFVFLSAFFISFICLMKKKTLITKMDILTGLLVGIPNLFSSYFVILALKSINASTVFPVYSAGTIVLINILGFAVFKEPLKKKDKVAIIMTVAAIILINIR